MVGRFAKDPRRAFDRALLLHRKKHLLAILGLPPPHEYRIGGWHTITPKRGFQFRVPPKGDKERGLLPGEGPRKGTAGHEGEIPQEVWRSRLRIHVEDVLHVSQVGEQRLGDDLDS
jgi:hypothetical protein